MSAAARGARSEAAVRPQTSYVIVAINAYVADTDEEAQRQFTSVIRMFVGMLTGKTKEPLQPPTDMTEELQDMWHHPAVYQMLKYSFVGSKQTVKQQLQGFLAETQADELITASSMYALEDRIKSTRLFGEIMAELNAPASHYVAFDGGPSRSTAS